MTGKASTIVFLVARRVLRLVGLGSTQDGRDIEIAVLRPQLAVLPRNPLAEAIPPLGLRLTPSASRIASSTEPFAGNVDPDHFTAIFSPAVPVNENTVF